MLLELAKDRELGMRRVLPMLEVGSGAGMRGSGVAAAPVAGLAIVKVDRVPPPRAVAAATAPARFATRVSQPRGGDTVDAAAAWHTPHVPLGGCVGERRRRAAVLAATITVIVRRRRRLQAV